MSRDPSAAHFTSYDVLRRRICNVFTSSASGRRRGGGGAPSNHSLSQWPQPVTHTSPKSQTQGENREVSQNNSKQGKREATRLNNRRKKIHLILRNFEPPGSNLRWTRSQSNSRCTAPHRLLVSSVQRLIAFDPCCKRRFRHLLRTFSLAVFFSPLDGNFNAELAPSTLLRPRRGRRCSRGGERGQFPHLCGIICHS